MEFIEVMPLNEVGRKEAIFDVILEGFFDELEGHLRVRVGESSFLGDGGAVDREGVVVEEFLIEVRSERSGGDFVFFAEVAPRLQMLVVGGLRDSLHGDGCGDLRLHVTKESGLDAKEGLQDLADGTLVGGALVGEIVERSGLAVLGQMPEGGDDIADMDCIDGEVLVPEEFHLFSQGLVDGGGDQSRGKPGEIAGAVDDGRAHDDEVQPSDLPQLLFSLGLRLGNAGPGLDPGVLFPGLRSRVIDLGGRDLNEDFDPPLRSLGRNRH